MEWNGFVQIINFYLLFRCLLVLSIFLKRVTCQFTIDSFTMSSIASACPSLPAAVFWGRRTTLTGDGTSHGSVVQYSCDPDYEIVGLSIIRCDNGAWYSSPPTCQSKISKCVCSSQCHKNNSLKFKRFIVLSH